MLNVTEKDYDEIRRLGKKLHIPIPEMFWGFKVESLDGGVLHDHDERGHSWVRNAYNWLTSQMCAVNAASTTYGAGYLAMKQINGTVSGSGYAIGMPTVNNSIELAGQGFSGAVNTATGLVVGTGTAAFDFEQHTLEAIINNGTNAGELLYLAFNPIVKNYDSSTSTYSVTHSRYFTNNSGGDIVVSEVGIYTPRIYVANGTGIAMVTRDVLETPVTVPDLARLTVTYTIGVAFPA
ncbi:hypothetical protein [Sporomusa termitida]|uniref:Uncharacterized protein n=1 Tax=Sporomusa termitida TaxID=2377 RepID=A0A517DSD9_9FIRM|nr:hypothetical protein [Sporomusa termitida]QDR80237.1 hypothetical protein SPTER_15560 [Sporomusa termitida]